MSGALYFGHVMTLNLICSSIRIMSLGCLGFRRLFSVPPDGSRSVQTMDIEIRSSENQIEEVGSRTITFAYDSVAAMW